MYQLEALSLSWKKLVHRLADCCGLKITKLAIGIEKILKRDKTPTLENEKQTELQVKVMSNRLIAEDAKNTLCWGDWWQSEKSTRTI